MLNIYLVRHGQDQDNERGILNGRRDKPLTPKGIEQAKDLAARIKKKGLSFDKIYSSPLKRAYITAEIIADSLGNNKPEILNYLIERDFGIMTGKSHTQIEKICKSNILKTPTFTYFLSPDGAETFPELIDRAKLVLRFVEGNNKNGNILLVTHGDIGKMIYAAYYNLYWKTVLKMFHFGNSDLLLMSDESSAQDVHVLKTEQVNL